MRRHRAPPAPRACLVESHLKPNTDPQPSIFTFTFSDLSFRFWIWSVKKISQCKKNQLRFGKNHSESFKNEGNLITGC